MGGRRNVFTVNPEGMARYLTPYLTMGKVQALSQDTLRRRDSALRRFMAWCDERGLEDPRQITKPILERYQRQLYYYRKDNGQPLSVSSQNLLLTPIKSFFKWLTQENYLLYNPASELILPKKPKHLPRTILSLEEIEQVFRQPDTTTVQGLRDRTLLEVLYGCGLRRIEMVNLSLSSIDYRRHTLLVREGKGAKDRYVPINARVAGWLDRYTRHSRPHLQIDIHNTTLFLDDHGQPLSRANLGARVKRYLNAAGIDAEGSCHLFRHAMATHMLENGADIRYIQALLGHNDLSSTETYTRVSITKLQVVYAATHPLSELTPPAVDQ